MVSKTIKKLGILLGLLLSTMAWAQPDLTIFPLSNPYQFPDDGQVYTIGFQVENNGTSDANDGANVFVDLQDPQMQFTGDFMFGSWTCLQTNAQAMHCQLFSNVAIGGSLVLEVPVQAQPGQFNATVSANVSPEGIGDANPADNNTSLSVNYVAAGPLPDLTTSMAFAPGFGNPFDPVDPIEIDVTVTNNGDDGNNIVMLFDGENFNFNQPGSDPNCFFGQNGIECTATFLAASQSVTFRVAGVVDQLAPNGMYNLNADANSTDGEAFPSDNMSSMTYIVGPVGSPEIDVDKFVWDGVNNTGPVTNLPQNGVAEYLVYLNNTGSADATNVDLTDTLPPDVTFDATLNGGVNPQYYQDMIGNCAFTGSTLTCNVPTVAAGATQNLVKIFARVTGAPGNVVTNTASSTFADGNSTNNAANATFTIDAAPAAADLSASIVTSQSTYNVGDTIAIQADVTNLTAGVNVDAVQMTVNLLNESSFQNVTADPIFTCAHDGAQTGGVVTCQSNANFLNGNTTALINIDALATQDTGGLVNLTGTVTSSNNADPNNANNSPTTPVQIFGAPNDFFITKSASVNNALVGDNFDFQFQVGHSVTPGSDAFDVTIQDNLPPEVSYQGFTDQSTNVTFSCVHDGSPTGGLVTCDTGGTAFSFGSTADILIHVTAEGDGTINNTATVTAFSDPDGTTGNNTSTTGVVINIPFTTVALNKQAMIGGVAVNDVPYGSAFTYQLDITNTGAHDVINLNVFDLIPNDVTLNGYQASPNWSCTDFPFSGQTKVDCWYNGNMPTSANETITIDVTATNSTAVTSINNQMDAEAYNFTAAQSAFNTVNLVSPGLMIDLLQNPDPVDAGAQFDYQVTVDNTGTQDLSAVVVDMDVPTGISYVSATSSVGSCTENAGTVNCPLGLLATGDSVNITVTAQAPANPDANNSYDFHAYGQSPDLPATQSAFIPTNVTPPPMPDFQMTLSGNTTQVMQGSVSTLSYDIQNTGNVPLDPITLQLDVAPGFSVNNQTNNSMTCQLNGLVLTCQNQTPLAVSGTLQGTIEIQAGNATGGQQHQLQVTANGNSKAANFSQTIIPRQNVFVDVALTKTASVTQIGTNQPFEYGFTIQNVGNRNVQNMTLTDTLPAGIVFDGYNGVGWHCQGTTTIQCSHPGPLNIGDTMDGPTLAVTSPNASGTIDNQATLSVAGDIDTSNNSSSVSVLVGQTTQYQSDLLINKTASSDQVIAGEPLNWTIEVGNAGPDVAVEFTISDQFPNGFVAEGIMTDNGLNCVMMTDSLLCDGQLLTIGDSKQVVIQGHVDAGFQGMMSNQALGLITGTDPDTNNNQATAQVNVVPHQNNIADLSVGVAADQSQIIQGNTFVLDVTAGNAGPDPAQMATLDIQIQGLIDGINVLSPMGWQCQSNGGQASCLYPTDLPSGSSHVLQFEVQTQRVVQTAQPISIHASISAVSQDDNMANNQAMLTTDVNATPTEDEFLQHMQGVMGAMDDQTDQAIRNVASYCAREYHWAIEDGVCDVLWNATGDDHDDMHDMMREITPNEVLGQSNSAAEIITSQFRNIDSRLSELRGGAGGFSVSGLRANYGNESIPLGMLAYLNAGEDEQGNAVNDFISPWGFFINGTISMGERDKTGRELGFDFDTYGITAGVDYRLSHNKVLGVALGYANFDSEIEDEAEMQSDGLTLTGYGSFYIKDNFYIDGRISYGQPNFDQSRRINFSLRDLEVDRVARGETDANQYTAAFSMGYHFNKKAWNITPNASLRYVNTQIDGFSETGAGGYNFEYGDQNIKSMVASFGVSVSRAISLERGVITPQFDINMSREMENDGGFIEARFINAPDDEIFLIATDEPDRTYGQAGLGLVFIGANGKQAYINYRSIFGLDGFSRGTINLGLRFEF